MTKLAFRRPTGFDASSLWSRRQSHRSAAFPDDRHAESFVPHGGRTRALDVDGYPVDYRIRRVA